MNKTTALVFAGAFVAVTVGCSTVPSGNRSSRDAVEPVAASAHRMHGYVISRRHGDFRIVDGREQRLDVEYGWDYDAGVAYRTIRDDAGVVLERVELPGADLPLTKAESDRVEQLVRAHPALKDLISAPDVRVWAGGFVYRVPGDRHCDRGSRCVHAIAAGDYGNKEITHSIVDLQTDRVVYPIYTTTGGANAVGLK